MTTEAELIEKVARALAMADGGTITGPSRCKATDEFGWPGEIPLGKYSDAHWPRFKHAASFAIGAIRPLIEEEARDKMLRELCEFWPDGLVVVSRGPKETVLQVVRAFATEHNILLVTKGETDND
jgi:hypothetical protein